MSYINNYAMYKAYTRVALITPNIYSHFWKLKIKL